MMLAALGAMAFAVPALADDAATPTPTAQQQCRTERGASSVLFKQTYGTNHTRSNAMGKCVSHRTSATGRAHADAHADAARACTAEQADPATFAADYGAGKNAYGRCVSGKTRAQTTATVRAQVKAEIKAMKACGADRKADPATFKATYGTNRNKTNAMGKCVSALAKAQQDAPAS